MKKHVHDELQRQDWGAIGKDLLVYTSIRARIYSWRTGSSLRLADTETADDIVQRVIEKTLNGERQWDPEKGPLKPWLFDQVKSMVDALAKSSTNRPDPLLDEVAEDFGTLSDEFGVQRVCVAHEQTPEHIILDAEQDAEQTEEMSRTVGQVFEAVEGDTELEELLEVIMGGCEPKPRYLAEKLCVPVDNIYNRNETTSETGEGPRKGTQ